MNNYIHKIIDFFFHHEVSDEITERVYNRMVFPVEDKAREEAVSHIWDKLDDASCSDEKIEKAFYNLETSLGLKKEEEIDISDLKWEEKEIIYALLKHFQEAEKASFL